MEDKCPYCKKEDCIPGCVYGNAENYGGGTYYVPCDHCGRMLEVGATRVVEIYYINKSNKKREDCSFFHLVKENIS